MNGGLHCGVLRALWNIRGAETRGRLALNAGRIAGGKLGGDAG